VESVTRCSATWKTLRLGLVDGLGDVVGLAVGQLGDVAGHVDQPSEHAVSWTILA
jgi:hypothetical protein